jgi:hypothetical protein
VNADALLYACNAARLEPIRSGADFIKEHPINLSYGKYPISFMVNFSFTGSLSNQQLDRTTVEFIDNYSARDCASYYSCIYRPDISRVYLAQEKVEGLVQDETRPSLLAAVGAVINRAPSKAAI